MSVPMSPEEQRQYWKRLEAENATKQEIEAPGAFDGLKAVLDKFEDQMAYAVGISPEWFRRQREKMASGTFATVEQPDEE